MFTAKHTIEGFDPDLFRAMQQESRRQEDHIELIASENYASPRVLQAQGSVLTNKYAEGYPGKRYYGGCEYVDVAERLAIERAKALFGRSTPTSSRTPAPRPTPRCTWPCWSPATALLGMSLAHGGHLTHGASVNFSGKLYKACPTGCTRTPRRSTTARSSGSPASTSRR